VLLMDEPFGALDAFQRAIMHWELTRIWKATKASIIFVTHSLEDGHVRHELSESPEVYAIFQRGRRVSASQSP